MNSATFESIHKDFMYSSTYRMNVNVSQMFDFQDIQCTQQEKHHNQFRQHFVQICIDTAAELPDEVRDRMPTILCVHGSGGSHEDFIPLLKNLVDEYGFRAVCLNWPGDRKSYFWNLKFKKNQKWEKNKCHPHEHPHSGVQHIDQIDKLYLIGSPSIFMYLLIWLGYGKTEGYTRKRWFFIPVSIRRCSEFSVIFPARDKIK